MVGRNGSKACMLIKVGFNGIIKHQHKGLRLKSCCWYFISFLCL